LFDFAHRSFNPKCKEDDKIRLKISDFLGVDKITAQHNQTFCEYLKNTCEVDDETCKKFEKINDMDVCDFAKAFCKSSWDDKKKQKMEGIVTTTNGQGLQIEQILRIQRWSRRFESLWRVGQSYRPVPIFNNGLGFPQNNQMFLWFVLL